MKRLLFAAAVACFSLVSCADKKNGTPKEVLTAWFDAMAKKDLAAAKELSTPESQMLFSKMEENAKNDTASSKEFDKSRMEIGEPVITGDNAKVPVKDKESGTMVNYPMKKLDGKWKVAFDKGSMMEMSMDAMKSNNMNLGDSLDKSLDDMKNMNVDSMMDNAMDSANMDRKN